MPYPILKFEFNKDTYHDNSWFHKFFYEDYYGNTLSKEKYKYAKSFFDGYAFVYKYDKKWDIINPIGESVLKTFRFSKIINTAFNCISPNNEFFLKNYIIRHNLIVSVDCGQLKKEFDSLNIKVKGYPDDLNRKGCLLINRYDGGMLISLIEDFSLPGNGLIAVKHFDKEWGFISVESFNRHLLGKFKFDETFEFACGFNDGLAKVKKDGYFGFIDTTGKLIVPAIYDDARSFSEGYAAVAIAKCRKLKDWNTGTYISDFAWNFIDKNNEKLLNKPKDNLSRINENKNYYFEDNSSMYSSAYENLNPNYFKEHSLEGIVCSNNFIGRPFADFWYGSTIFGQFSPRYIVDFLTAQISDELGFKKWFVDLSQKSTSAYLYLNSRKEVEAETLYIDFDTTQMEIDYIKGFNSLETKYGFDYTSGNWKTKKKDNEYSSRANEVDNIDWSNYDDNLDMDQQSIDFWNQF
ncbi:MAG: WG repeat-containing protein [Bacteroidota bacterium]